LFFFLWFFFFFFFFLKVNHRKSTVYWRSNEGFTNVRTDYRRRILTNTASLKLVGYPQARTFCLLPIQYDKFNFYFYKFIEKNRKGMSADVWGNAKECANHGTVAVKIHCALLIWHDLHYHFAYILPISSIRKGRVSANNINLSFFFSFHTTRNT